MQFGGSFMERRSDLRMVGDSRGFNLIELMTAISVFSILAAIAIPSFMSFQPSMRLNGGAREVMSKLRWARAQAVEQNATYVVDFPNDHTIRAFKDDNLNGTWDSGETTQTFDIQTDYTGVTFTVSGSNPQFTGRGTASGATTITVTNTSGSRDVKVTAPGNVKIS
jgi:prepilin-type N-terminal cleavage/methylation domain-containing protein